MAATNPLQFKATKTVQFASQCAHVIDEFGSKTCKRKTRRLVWAMYQNAWRFACVQHADQVRWNRVSAK